MCRNGFGVMFEPASPVVATAGAGLVLAAMARQRLYLLYGLQRTLEGHGSDSRGVAAGAWPAGRAPARAWAGCRAAVPSRGRPGRVHLVAVSARVASRRAAAPRCGQ